MSLCLYVLPVLLSLFLPFVCFSIDFLFLLSFIVLLFLDYYLFSNERERGNMNVDLDLDVKGGVEDLGRVEGEDCNQNTCMIKTSFFEQKAKESFTECELNKSTK